LDLAPYFPFNVTVLLSLVKIFKLCVFATSYSKWIAFWSPSSKSEKLLHVTPWTYPHPVHSRLENSGRWSCWPFKYIRWISDLNSICKLSKQCDVRTVGRGTREVYTNIILKDYLSISEQQSYR
jgi:hypothetical protein